MTNKVKRNEKMKIQYSLILLVLLCAGCQTINLEEYEIYKVGPICHSRGDCFDNPKAFCINWCEEEHYEFRRK